MSNYTQPICDACWTQRQPNREPTRFVGGGEERCAFCGHETTSGIFVRVDPKTVPFPRKEDQ